MDIGSLMYPGAKIPVHIGAVETVELDELIGGGGFGHVWRVKDAATGDVYALKVIRNIDASAEHVRQMRLVDRVRLEAGVSIPSQHCVRALGMCEWDPRTYLLLMELVHGETLEDLIEEQALSAEQKRDIFIQTLTGVGDAHRANIIHRDLKPQNLMVTNSGLVKVLDFGIAKFVDHRLTTVGFFGTYPYMAPEILLIGASIADARTDIYALGHILFQMATGVHFWRSMGWKSNVEGLTAFGAWLNAPTMRTETIELSDFDCDFLRNGRDILARMVKVHADDRYASISEILADLGVEPETQPLRLDDIGDPLSILIVESGGTRNSRAVLGLADGETRVLGRYDIAGDDGSISSRHIEFQRRGSRYFVRDAGSKNGTLLRGVALPKNDGFTEVFHGDRIKLAEVFLRFAFLPKQDLGMGAG